MLILQPLTEQEEDYGWILYYVCFIVIMFILFLVSCCTALDHTNAMRELSRFDLSAWRMLGGTLQVPFFKLNEFANFIAGRPTGQYDALAYTVDYWLKNDLHASWDKLASAVEKCGDAVRASSIRENMGIAPTAGKARISQACSPCMLHSVV